MNFVNLVGTMLVAGFYSVVKLGKLADEHNPVINI